jgi:CheY-like chemotaxis protein
MSLLILVVDDEPDVEILFRQRFRRDLHAGRFTMEFAQSGPDALQRISDATDVSLILILSDINMPGMSGLELLPRAKALRPDVPVIMITTYEDAQGHRGASRYPYLRPRVRVLARRGRRVPGQDQKPVNPRRN